MKQTLQGDIGVVFCGIQLHRGLFSYKKQKIVIHIYSKNLFI